MRRTYGSLLSAPFDQPHNEALRLQIISACYMAILQWEPRVQLTAISYDTAADGSMVVAIIVHRADSGAGLSLTIPVS